MSPRAEIHVRQATNALSNQPQRGCYSVTDCDDNGTSGFKENLFCILCSAIIEARPELKVENRVVTSRAGCHSNKAYRSKTKWFDMRRERVEDSSVTFSFYNRFNVYTMHAIR